MTSLLTASQRNQGSPTPAAEGWARLAVASPLGQLRLVARDARLVAVVFKEHRNPWAFMRGQAATATAIATANDATAAVLSQAAGELEAFFADRLRQFSTPLGFEVGTPFYREVWAALLEIPFGQRRSYGELARLLGRPSAARAVGTAVARNPLSLFVPCHRVVGGEGQLTGFAGGLPAKQWLLQHEGAASPRDAAPAHQLTLG